VKKALIVGVSGQDGGYLASLLLEKGYEVHGTSRDPARASFITLRALGSAGRVVVHAMTPTDFSSVLSLLRLVHADEIYNLSGQSSVGLSFQQPLETFDSITIATMHLREWPSDIAMSAGNPAKAEAVLGWKATYDLDMIARTLVG